MEKKLSVIKANMSISDKALTISDLVRHGQIEELVHLFNENRLSYNLAADMFSMVCKKPLLCPDFLEFCILLCKNNSLERTSFINENTDANSVSFLDNDYSRCALQAFQGIYYASDEAETDFNSVCESVYSGRSKYAILPLFNSRDGLIISLYRLLQKYDLKIIASTKVLMNDGNTETDFFLVSRQPFDEHFNLSSRMMLSVTHSYDNTIPHILSAMTSQSIKLISINTLPLEYTDERCESVIIFDISSCEPEAVKCFLHSSLPEVNIVGIYSIVK